MEAGYTVYSESDNTTRYDFDRNIGGLDSVNTKHEDTRLELKTFGRVPYVYYAGQSDFRKFSLKNTFHYNYDTGETARQQVDRFKALVAKREVLVVENSQGQKFLCDVNITGESAPLLYVEEDLDYIEITIECTQIDF